MQTELSCHTCIVFAQRRYTLLAGVQRSRQLVAHTLRSHIRAKDSRPGHEAPTRIFRDAMRHVSNLRALDDQGPLSAAKRDVATYCPFSTDLFHPRPAILPAKGDHMMVSSAMTAMTSRSGSCTGWQTSHDGIGSTVESTATLLQPNSSDEGEAAGAKRLLGSIDFATLKAPCCCAPSSQQQQNTLARKLIGHYAAVHGCAACGSLCHRQQMDAGICTDCSRNSGRSARAAQVIQPIRWLPLIPAACGSLPACTHRAQDSSCSCLPEMPLVSSLTDYLMHTLVADVHTYTFVGKHYALIGIRMLSVAGRMRRALL